MTWEWVINDIIFFFGSSQVTFIYIALLTIQIVTKQLHNIKTGNNVNNVKWQDWTQHFQLKAFRYLIQWWHRPAQFSLNSICAVKSTISLERSVPNLASQRPQRQGTKTPSVTECRKNLGRNQAQSGGQFPSGQMNQQFVPTAAKSACRGSTGSSGLFLMAV